MHIVSHLIFFLSAIIVASPTVVNPRDNERLLFARENQAGPQSLAIYPRIDKSLDTGEDANVNLSLHTDTSCGAQVKFMDHPVLYNTSYNTADDTTGKNAKNAQQIQAYKLSRSLNSSEELDLYLSAACEKYYRRVSKPNKKEGCHALAEYPIIMCVKIVI